MAKAVQDLSNGADKARIKAGLEAQIRAHTLEVAVESFLLQAKIEAITPCPRSRIYH